jgi:hypothetical protein
MVELEADCRSKARGLIGLVVRASRLGARIPASTSPNRGLRLSASAAFFHTARDAAARRRGVEAGILARPHELSARARLRDVNWRNGAEQEMVELEADRCQPLRAHGCAPKFTHGSGPLATPATTPLLDGLL